MYLDGPGLQAVLELMRNPIIPVVDLFCAPKDRVSVVCFCVWFSSDHCH